MTIIGHKHTQLTKNETQTHSSRDFELSRSSGKFEIWTRTNEGVVVWPEIESALFEWGHG